MDLCFFYCFSLPWNFLTFLRPSSIFKKDIFYILCNIFGGAKPSAKAQRPTCTWGIGEEQGGQCSWNSVSNSWGVRRWGLRGNGDPVTRGFTWAGVSRGMTGSDSILIGSPLLPQEEDCNDTGQRWWRDGPRRWDGSWMEVSWYCTDFIGTANKICWRARGMWGGRERGLKDDPEVLA